MSAVRSSGLPATDEQYGALPGRMAWLRGEVSFGETDLRQEADGRFSLLLRFQQGGRVGGPVVFGGADRAVLSQSGGALLGLIRRVNMEPISTIPAADLRPTVLGQLGLASFRLDAPRRRLTLSSAPLIGAGADALPLLDPRAWGDGVEHVSCRVDQDELTLDGVSAAAGSNPAHGPRAPHAPHARPRRSLTGVPGRTGRVARGGRCCASSTAASRASSSRRQEHLALALVRPSLPAARSTSLQPSPR